MARTGEGGTLDRNVDNLLEQLGPLERVDVAVFLVAQRDVVELVRLVSRHERHCLHQLVQRLDQNRIVRQRLHVRLEVGNVHGQLCHRRGSDPVHRRRQRQRQNRRRRIRDGVEQHQVLERRRQ